MSARLSSVPLLRPYNKGHSRAEDEKLAHELFFGTSTIIDEKTGRCRHDYVAESDERRAIEALQRLLLFSCGDLNPEILGGLLCALDPGGSFGQRLVFQAKEKKTARRRHDGPSDIYLCPVPETRGIANLGRCSPRQGEIWVVAKRHI